MSILALTFNGVSLTPISHQNQTWLTSVELAKALGYAHENGVTKIYNRYKDEFSASMSTILPTTQIGSLVESSGLQKEQRIFSLRGCHLIAMFARTAIAKQFRVWVLDVLDKEVGQPKILEPENNAQVYLTPEMARHVQERINQLCAIQNKHHNELYHELKTVFKANSYTLIPVTRYVDVCAYLGCDPIYKMPERIMIDVNELELLSQISRMERNELIELRAFKKKAFLPHEAATKLKELGFHVRYVEGELVENEKPTPTPKPKDKPMTYHEWLDVMNKMDAGDFVLFKKIV